jgi:hypothetical protein
MPTYTTAGVVCDALGHAAWESVWLDPDDPHIAHRARSVSAQPGGNFRGQQPAAIPVDWEHRIPLGEVVHLERRDGNLAAVAVVDLPDEAVDDDLPLYFSGEIEGSYSNDSLVGDDLVLRSLAITLNPAGGRAASPPGPTRRTTTPTRSGQPGSSDHRQGRRRRSEPSARRPALHPRRPRSTRGPLDSERRSTAARADDRVPQGGPILSVR